MKKMQEKRREMSKGRSKMGLWLVSLTWVRSSRRGVKFRKAPVRKCDRVLA